LRARTFGVRPGHISLRGRSLLAAGDPGGRGFEPGKSLTCVKALGERAM
jgi:hypothetical protein